MSHRSRSTATHRAKSSRASRPISAPLRGRLVESDKLRQPQPAELQLQECKQTRRSSHHDSERDHKSHHEHNNYHRSHRDSRLHEVTELQKSFHNSHRGHSSLPSHGTISDARQELRPATASGERLRRSHGHSHSVTSGARGEHSARSGARRSLGASGHGGADGCAKHRADNEMSESASCAGATLSSAYVVPQPGNGSCLFHSLSHGLGQGNASSLRREICSYIANHPDVKIADAPLKSWIKHDSGCDTKSYASNMKSDSCWGGGIEMGAFAKMKCVNVHVYEKCPKGFQRTSTFDVPKAQKTINVLYQRGTHYDALEF